MPTNVEVEEAGRFADLALASIHCEYPNHLSHTVASEADVRPPHLLTPAFYGAFDWHSAVHGHWCLVRLLRLHGEGRFAPRAEAALDADLAAERLASWLPKLRWPVRSGEHSQTAFALGLALDWAAVSGDARFAALARA